MFVIAQMKHIYSHPVDSFSPVLLSSQNVGSAAREKRKGEKSEMAEQQRLFIIEHRLCDW